MSLLSEVKANVVEGIPYVVGEKGTFSNLVCEEAVVLQLESGNVIVKGPLTLVDATDETKEGSVNQVGDSTVFSDILSCALPPTNNLSLCNKQYVDNLVTGTAVVVQTTATSLNSDFYGTFVPSSTTGVQTLGVGLGLKYNPGTDTLTVSNVSGNVASTNSVNTAVVTTNANFYLPFASSSSSGVQALNVDVGIQYNPNTNILTVGNITANNISSVSQVITTSTATNADFFPTFTASGATGVQSLNVNSGLKYNPSTDTLTVNSIVGNVSNSTLINTSLTTSNTDFYPTFVDSFTTGAQGLKVNSNFKYNPSSDTLTVNSVVGSVSNAAAIQTTAVSTNATFYPTFAPSSATGAQSLNVDSGIAYNPFTDTLTVGNLVSNAAPSLEVVTGTNPITPSVATTFLGGTTHTLSSGSILGQQKTIIKITDNVFSPLLTFNTRMINYSSFGTPNLNVLKYDPVNNFMYVGGLFDSIGGLIYVPYFSSNISYYNFANNSWNALPDSSPNEYWGLLQSVYDILLSGTKVFFCGILDYAFNTTGSKFVSLRGIGFYDHVTKDVYQLLNGGIPGTEGITSGSGYGNKMLILGDYLYLGGSFSEVGAVQYTSNIARWHIPSQTWSALEQGIIASGNVTNMVAEGTNIWVSGNFLNVVDSLGNAVPFTRCLAKFDTVTGTWSGYNDVLSGVVTGSIFLTPGSLLINGFFTSSANIPKLLNTALLDTNTLTLTQFSVLNSVGVFYKDDDGTLWALRGTGLGSTTETGLQGNNISGAFPPYIYDSNAGKWSNLLGSCNISAHTMEKTNVPGEFWVSFLNGSYVDGGKLTGTGSLLKMNKNNLVRVSSNLEVSGQPNRDRFHLIWKGQTVKLTNIDNSNWGVLQNSVLSSNASIGAQGQTFFY